MHRKSFDKVKNSQTWSYWNLVIWARGWKKKFRHHHAKKSSGDSPPYHFSIWPTNNFSMHTNMNIQTIFCLALHQWLFHSPKYTHITLHKSQKHHPPEKLERTTLLIKLNEPPSKIRCTILHSNILILLQTINVLNRCYFQKMF